MAVLWAVLVSAGCLVSQKVAGGSAEQGNALTGTITGPGGGTRAGVLVRLRPAAYLADTSGKESPDGTPASRPGPIRNAYSDPEGRFAFTDLPPGRFTLEAAIPGWAALSRFEIPPTDTSIALGDLRLAPTGTLQGWAKPPAGQSSAVYVQIVGLERMARTEAGNGYFRVDDLPASPYTVRLSTALPHLNPLEKEFRVDSGDTTVLDTVIMESFEGEDYAAWPFSKSLALNLPAGLPDPGEVLADFPLLVRLNRQNFDFSQSRGTDLRFSLGSKRLRYQVERWEPDSGRAEIWVRLDTLRSGGPAPSLTVHWGLAGARDGSDGKAVFDTAAGFAGVWHLDEEYPGLGTRNAYLDASGAGNHGNDSIVSAERGGAVGYGHGFEAGLTDNIEVPSPPNLMNDNEEVTVTAWVRTSLAATQCVFKKISRFALYVEADGNLMFEIYRGTWIHFRAGGRNAADGAWHHLAAVAGGGEVRLYLDGALLGTHAYADTPEAGSGSVCIGSAGNLPQDSWWQGNLDEIRVSRLARPPSWIRLEYESQKPGAEVLAR